MSPVGVGVGGDGLEHHGGGSVAQRAVHDVGVARYPSAVSNASVHVTVLNNKKRERQLY